MSFKDQVARLKEAVDIVDVIEASGVSLQSSGASYKGLCPFHQEKTPSFVVHPHFQNYRCFGCGAQGDVLTFVMESEGLDFMDSVRSLARDKGIELDLDDEESEASVQFSKLRECVKDAANFFLAKFRALPKDHRAVSEITDRGLRPSGGGMHYGYAPEGGKALVSFLRSRGHSDSIMKEAGVVRESSKTGKLYDFWQGRLIFFITDTVGRPVGFSGRKLFDDDRGGKYVNSPDTPLFKKSHVLFNMSQARKSIAEQKLVYVVEGQFDVSAFVGAGIPNVVASSGTAFTEHHGALLRRAVGEDGKVVFVFDSDDAGREAAVKVFNTVSSVHEVSYLVSLPEGKDPCDVVAGGGDLADLVSSQGAVPLVEHVLRCAEESVDMGTSLGRTAYGEKAAEYLASIDSRPLRETYERQLSISLMTELSSVREMVRDARAKRSSSGKDDNVESHVDVLHERYESEHDEESIVARMRKDDRYRLSARLIRLAAEDPYFSVALAKTRKFVPRPLWGVVKEVSELSGERVIPERFTLSQVMEEILDRDVSPYSDIMNRREKKELFLYLRQSLRESVDRDAQNDAAHRVMDALSDSSGMESVKLLERALNATEEDVEL